VMQSSRIRIQTLTNCFSSPSLMWRGGSKMFSLVTKALWITMCIPGIFVLCYVNHTKVTIIMVACRLSPNSRYIKWHTLSSPTQPSF
jgi:hypothetical protein